MYVVIILLIVIFSQILLLRHGIGLGTAVRLRACPDQFDDDALILAVTEFQKLRDPVDFIKCLLHKRPDLLDATNEFGSALSEAAFIGGISSYMTAIIILFSSNSVVTHLCQCMHA